MSKDKRFLRQCINCKQMKKKEDLIRITKDYKTNEIKINNESSITGRSVYICKSPECITNTLKKKKIEKLLKTNLTDNLKENLYSSVLKK